jgi:hypothetical protein
METPTAVNLDNMSVSLNSYTWVLGMLLIGLAGLAAFLWQRRRAM